MHIVAIAGSLRQESMNRQLAEAAGRIVYELDPAIQFTLLDWADVPLFNEDIEGPRRQPSRGCASKFSMPTASGSSHPNTTISSLAHSRTFLIGFPAL